MNLSALFIKRPVTTTLIMLGIIVFGVMAYRQLPVSDLPTVDFPTIQVQAGLPGASPETMASAVALPLEKQFATIAGLDSINSTSSQGSTNITLQFDLSRNIDAAAQDVQAMIAQGRAPAAAADAGAAVVPEGRIPAISRCIFLVLRSATLPLSTVDEYARVDDRAAHLDGERRRAGADVFGAAKYAVRIDLDPRAARGARHRHRRSRHRDHERERQPADRHDLRRRQDVHRPGQRPAAARRGLRADDHRLPQRQPGAARRSRARLRRRRERQDRRPGTAASAAIYLVDPEAAGHQRRRRSSTRSRRCCRRSASSCRPRCRSTSAPIARRRSASRCTTSSSRCC